MTRPAVLFVHGQAADAHYWDDVRNRVPGPTAALDLPWHGQEDDLPADPTAAYRAYGDTVARRVTELPDRVALVGHSLGSQAILEALISMSDAGGLDKVDRVLLSGVMPEPSPEGDAMMQGFAQLIEAQDLSAALLETLADLWMLGGGSDDRDRARRVLQSLLASATPARMAMSCRSLVGRPPLVPRLPANLPPITVVAASADRATPHAAAQPVLDAVQPVRLVHQQGPHHWPSLDPVACADEVIQWLGTPEAKG